MILGHWYCFLDPPSRRSATAHLGVVGDRTSGMLQRTIGMCIVLEACRLRGEVQSTGVLDLLFSLER